MVNYIKDKVWEANLNKSKVRDGVPKTIKLPKKGLPPRTKCMRNMLPPPLLTNCLYTTPTVLFKETGLLQKPTNCAEHKVDPN